MKNEQVLKLLKISYKTLLKYCNNGIIRKIKIDGNKYEYNDDDVMKFLNNSKIVLINPEKQIVEKTYNNINEVFNDLKISLYVLKKSLNHTSVCCGDYLLKYLNDATESNIIIYSNDFNKAIYDKKIVQIDYKKQVICKIYNNIEEVITNLKVNKICVYNSLNNVSNSCAGFILKYLKDATEENIILYSNKHNIAINDKKIVLIDPKKQTIDKIYNNKKDVIAELNITKDMLDSCLYHISHTCCGYILKFLNDANEENIKLYSSKNNKALDGTVRCPGCLKWFEVSEFCGYCRPCDIMKSNNYSKTFNGFFNNMANSMKNRSNIRLNKGLKSGVCTIDANTLKKIYENQKGLCYYSSLPLCVTPKSNWQASPERCSNSIGYTIENTKLICLEFNIGHGQWNKNKIKLLEILSQQDVDIKELERKIEDAKKPSIKKDYSKRKIKIIDDIELFECNKCLEYKLFTMFRVINKEMKDIKIKSPHTFCKLCEKNEQHVYSNSFVGFVKKRLKNAKNHATKIAKNKNRKDENSEFNLTINDIFDKLLEQKGKCYYSNVPLKYTQNTEWMLSIERKNNFEGYVKNNVVLICIEFNTTDTTTYRTSQGTGNSQWNKNKINLLMETINYSKQ